jgi:uncharacterized damage-inducible protein DinB
MFVEALSTFYHYCDWATQRVLRAAADLTPAEWLEQGVVGQDSVRDTLVHLISAQRSWLAFWRGGDAAYQPLEPADYLDVAAVQTAWSELTDATESFLAGLTEADLAREYHRPSPTGRVHVHTLWQMLLHVANHGTQHRSEVALLLTSFGHSPGGLDFSEYLRSLADSSKSADKTEIGPG